MDNNNIMNTADFDGLHEECGVFGAYDFDGEDVASTIYYGLFALQHRGQESCGIAVRMQSFLWLSTVVWRCPRGQAGSHYKRQRRSRKGYGMRGSSRLLEDEKHLVHHAHSASRTRRRLGRCQNPGVPAFSFRAQAELLRIQRSSVPLLRRAA